MDSEKSEHGPQRRRNAAGRPLHCCCICGKLDVWGEGWSTYCSDGDIDESRPIPKFCSKTCRKHGGPRARNVTAEMKKVARDAEWREPDIAWRKMTDRELYAHHAAAQRDGDRRAYEAAVARQKEERDP